MRAQIKQIDIESGLAGQRTYTTETTYLGWDGCKEITIIVKEPTAQMNVNPLGSSVDIDLTIAQTQTQTIFKTSGNL